MMARLYEKLCALCARAKTAAKQPSAQISLLPVAAAEMSTFIRHSLRETFVRGCA